MTVREARRAEALDRIADHMLHHGLAPSTLRALGGAAGVSDRMLLYYFADKDDIVVAALGSIASRLGAVLARVAPDGRRMEEAEALGELAMICRSEALRPFMRVWLELVCLAGRGEQPFLAAAGQIADYFIGWVAGRLAVDGDPQRMAAAARLIAVVDGVVLLDLAGRAVYADMALAAARSAILPAAPGSHETTARS